MGLTKAEREARAQAAAEEAQVDEVVAAAEAAPSSEFAVMRHKDINVPAIASRKALKEVYEPKGWKEDTETSVSQARAEITASTRKADEPT